ncbi:FOLE_1 [Blepharisma stoltei]|uniref:GTP cyclohydrolase 1 n=1 Tax=Blepharisma stoltei TaxID=1481888 RepID=A0AAU9JT98_9CILI|nr:unnamed protein product [Blepharisma stoltei]
MKNQKQREQDLKEIEKAYSTILSKLPLTNEGVESTPKRAAKALLELTQGYHTTPEEKIGEGIFPYEGDGVVHVKGLEICSLCEHHLLPFIGTCSITYIPDKKILGLSKLKRISDIYARRLQVQERLTEQIAEAIEKSVNPKGVLVVIRSVHLCMKMRGVCEKDPETCTVVRKGEFARNQLLTMQYVSESHQAPKL